MQVKIQKKFDLVATLASLEKQGDYFELDKTQVNVASVRSCATRYSATAGVKFSVTEEGPILKVERK